MKTELVELVEQTLSEGYYDFKEGQWIERSKMKYKGQELYALVQGTQKNGGLKEIGRASCRERV